ncbi:hypothetical protein HYC85_007639 [Camellia sinensis]|uniref:EXPERA domain-containing protein n=1 Tax=Camellia sinensis TaxID=4442 RepID=A0A7J7HPH9_CAMSI|nr:hypothetical protein HYC85_007639 [Camellia sinensis]
MVMVSVMKLMDRVLIVFSIAFGVAAPLDAGLLFLTPNLDPNNNNNLLVHHLKPLYEFKYGDYLVTNKPAFFVALVWLEVVFLWPLQLLNLYGILSPHASWLPLTFLLFGASYCTTMSVNLSIDLCSVRSKVLCGDKCYTIVGATSIVRTSHLLNPYLCSVQSKVPCGDKCYTIMGATSIVRTNHLLNPYLCSDCHLYDLCSVSFGTVVMYAVLAEVMSHTVSDTLIMLYLLFIGCGVLSILRGLLTYYSSAAGKTTKITTRHESSGSGKKRA